VRELGQQGDQCKLLNVAICWCHSLVPNTNCRLDGICNLVDGVLCHIRLRNEKAISHFRWARARVEALREHSHQIGIHSISVF